MLQEKFLIFSKIARILGKFTRNVSAMRFNPLHYQSVEGDKILTLKFTEGNFEKKMEVSQAGKMDLLWWINSTDDSFSPIKIPHCSLLLKTDASKSGWGAIFDI